MDSQPSDAKVHLSRIREAIRAGNWEGADELARNLPLAPIPSGVKALGDYLIALNQTLVFAKASRSNAAAALARVRAAATFQAGRQDFAELAQSRQAVESGALLLSET